MNPLWPCPKCGRGFANRNQFHFCSNRRLDEHFVRRDPQVVATFERLLRVAEKSGPVTVNPEKTRIAFQVRMSFAVSRCGVTGGWTCRPRPPAREPALPAHRRHLAAKPGARLQAARTIRGR